MTIDTLPGFSLVTSVAGTGCTRAMKSARRNSENAGGSYKTGPEVGHVDRSSKEQYNVHGVESKAFGARTDTEKRKQPVAGPVSLWTVIAKGNEAACSLSTNQSKSFTLPNRRFSGSSRAGTGRGASMTASASFTFPPRRLPAHENRAKAANMGPVATSSVLAANNGHVVAPFNCISNNNSNPSDAPGTPTLTLLKQSAPDTQETHEESEGLTRGPWRLNAEENRLAQRGELELNSLDTHTAYRLNAGAPMERFLFGGTKESNV